MRERVETGQYASESEVIREGLRALFERDQAVAAWLRTDVAAACDALAADPSQAISSEELRERIARRRAQR